MQVNQISCCSSWCQLSIRYICIHALFVYVNEFKSNLIRGARPMKTVVRIMPLGFRLKYIYTHTIYNVLPELQTESVEFESGHFEGRQNLKALLSWIMESSVYPVFLELGKYYRLKENDNAECAASIWTILFDIFVLWALQLCGETTLNCLGDALSSSNYSTNQTELQWWVG